MARAKKIIKIEVTQAHIEAAREIMGAADVSYWSFADWTDDGNHIRWKAADEKPDPPFEDRGTVSLLQLVEAAAVALADSKFTNQYQRAAFASLLFCPSDVDSDSETGDYLLQYAAFRKLVFG